MADSKETSDPQVNAPFSSAYGPTGWPSTPPRREPFHNATQLASPPGGYTAISLQPPSLPSGSGSSSQDQQTSPALALRQAALTFDLPSIFKRNTVGSRDIEEELGVQVADWSQVKRCGESFAPRKRHTGKVQEVQSTRSPVQKNISRSKTKGVKSGRTYTSKYRGVHQTFPTKRWEAQFRRNGKPASLGCFDLEQEAARAYDKMMLWCELHQTAGMRGGGITNFDPSEYERELDYLQNVSQEELVQKLRTEGRKQAAQRMMRQKRSGQLTYALLNEIDNFLNPPSSKPS